MNICIVVLGLGKSKGGGVIGGVNNVLNLAKGLVSNGHKIDIMTTYPLYPDGNYTVDLPGARIHYLTPHPFKGTRYSVAFTVKAVKKITELHQKEHLDLVCGYSSYPALALIPIIAGKINRLPKVHYLTSPIQRKTSLLFSFLKIYLSRIDMIIPLTHNVRRSLENIVTGEKIHKPIPPSVDLSIFSPEVSGEKVRKALSLGENPTLFFLGNLTKTKGIEVLLAALEIVKRSVPNIKLLMGLDMPIEGYQSKPLKSREEIESVNLEGHIIPLGILSNVAEVMTACDIFIAPFTSIEGIADYPISILEAMASGKPVIASRIGGIPELLTHRETGLLVKPGDVAELADSILYLLKQKEEAQKMASWGAKCVQQKFKPSIAVSELEDALQNVLERRN